MNTLNFTATASRQALPTLLTFAALAVAFLAPKTERDPPPTVVQPQNTQPGLAALTDSRILQVEVTLSRPGQPMFYSLCHTHPGVIDSPDAAALAYQDCPVRRTQSAQSERVSVPVPTDTEVLIAEIWPMNKVVSAEYRVFDLPASGEISLTLP